MIVMTEIELTEEEKKIVKFLEDNYPRDYSVSEISESLNIHRSTVSIRVDFLKRMKKIVQTRTLGKSILYTVRKKPDKRTSKNDKDRKDED